MCVWQLLKYFRVNKGLQVTKCKTKEADLSSNEQ